MNAKKTATNLALLIVALLIAAGVAAVIVVKVLGDLSNRFDLGSQARQYETVRAEIINTDPAVAAFRSEFPTCGEFITHFTQRMGPPSWNSQIQTQHPDWTAALGRDELFWVVLQFPLSTEYEVEQPYSILFANITEITYRRDGSRLSERYGDVHHTFVISNWDAFIQRHGSIAAAIEEKIAELASRESE